MLKKKYLYKFLPDEFNERAYNISLLIESIENIYTKNEKRKLQDMTRCRYPYFIIHNTCYIYWPGVEHINKRSKYVLEKLIGYTVPEEFSRAHYRNLRQHTERLLGSLLVPVDEDVCFTYADLYAKTYPGDTAGYRYVVGMHNYTAFQYLRPNISHALRTLIVPPLEELILPWSNSVPEPLTLLYRAWLTLRKRNDTNLFSMADKGVGFTPKGYLFINWSRFLQTKEADIEGKSLDAESVHNALINYKRPLTISKNILHRNLTCNYGASLNRALEDPVVRNPYLKTVCSMGFNRGVNDLRGYYTIIDPIALHRKRKIFDGREHHRRLEETRRSFAEFRERQKAGLPPKRTTKLHSFEFKPILYLQEPEEVTDKLSDYQWFNDSHEEQIHAIKRNGLYYFARPNYLSLAKDAACRADVQLWLRFLDSFKMMMEVSDSGKWDPEAKSIAIPHSDYLSTLTEDLRQKAGVAFIHDFLTRDVPWATDRERIKKIEYEKAMQKYMTTYFEKDPTLSEATIRSGNWYNKLVAKVAQEKIDPLAVRREAYVQLPTASSPSNVQFYSPMAIATVERFAKGSFGLIDKKYELTPLSPLMIGDTSPAPYILAWARFCLQIIKKQEEAPDSRELKGRCWTPSEDMVLSMYFRGMMRTTDDEWRELLTQLVSRNKMACRTRSMLHNALLKPILIPQRYNQYRFGRHTHTPIEAKRAMYLIGCIKAATHRGEKVHQRSPFIKKIFDASDEEVAAWFIPSRYRPEVFQHLIDPYT
ncbi:MAG: hypothetical protein PVI90_00515 [Desulfobacteraceae bacterium]|jgi:hypothetical protein